MIAPTKGANAMISRIVGLKVMSWCPSCLACHSSGSWNPVFCLRAHQKSWIPAFAGMTNLLTLHRIDFAHIDRRAVAEQHDEDRQADRRLGGRHCQDEEHEHLAGHVAEE